MILKRRVVLKKGGSLRGRLLNLRMLFSRSWMRWMRRGGWNLSNLGFHFLFNSLRMKLVLGSLIVGKSNVYAARSTGIV